jgi:twitching motility two-component system response regulator PilH
MQGSVGTTVIETDLNREDAAVAGRAYRVMVVDDSKTIRRTAETLLRKEGFEVVTAVDGFEALGKIADYQPDLIFLDIMMPRLDGYQTCALINTGSNAIQQGRSFRPGTGSGGGLRSLYDQAVYKRRFACCHSTLWRQHRMTVATPGVAGSLSINKEGVAMKQIMIVDDSPTDAHLLQKMLEKNGYQTLTAGNGSEGIEVARLMRPDLILMDVVMPGLNGFQATRELSSNPETASIPVIIVTRKDQKVDRVWGMRQGARDYLTKPVSESALLSLINEALAS